MLLRMKYGRAVSCRANLTWRDPRPTSHCPLSATVVGDSGQYGPAFAWRNIRMDKHFRMEVPFTGVFTQRRSPRLMMHSRISHPHAWRKSIFRKILPSPRHNRDRALYVITRGK